jgi:iron-sulfur cluster insertion protein
MSRRAARRALPSAKLVAERPRAYLADVNAVPISLSPSAAERVRLIADRQGKAPILRLAVDGGGCAGFTYKFSLCDAEEDDASTTCDGATLVVDPISLDLLAGSQVDYVEELGGAAFRVTNPNAASGCGCGTSFSI